MLFLYTSSLFCNVAFKHLTTLHSNICQRGIRTFVQCGIRTFGNVEFEFRILEHYVLALKIEIKFILERNLSPFFSLRNVVCVVFCCFRFAKKVWRRKMSSSTREINWQNDGSSSNNNNSRSCAVWPDLAKFRHFDKILALFGQFLVWVN